MGCESRQNSGQIEIHEKLQYVKVDSGVSWHICSLSELADRLEDDELQAPAEVAFCAACNEYIMLDVHRNS